jgi:hypothetical protein
VWVSSYSTDDIKQLLNRQRVADPVTVCADGSSIAAAVRSRFAESAPVQTSRQATVAELLAVAGHRIFLSHAVLVVSLWLFMLLRYFHVSLY